MSRPIGGGGGNSSGGGGGGSNPEMSPGTGGNRVKEGGSEITISIYPVNYTHTTQ